MVTWNNLNTLASFQALSETERVDLVSAMTGENGAERVKNYSIPMAAGLVYNYAAKQVDEKVLDALVKLAEEAQLGEKFTALYNGEVINTGEKRLVLHHMTRGQLGEAVEADGVDKRAFYVEQQERIAEFANKVHNGEITNAAGENVTKNFNSTNQYLVGAYTPPDGITVIGGKTGHTNTAGYNLVVLVQDSHHKEYVAVILGATTRDELYNQMNTLLSKI